MNKGVGKHFKFKTLKKEDIQGEKGVAEIMFMLETTREKSCI